MKRRTLPKPQPPLSGAEAIAKIREFTDTILLSFSCGKDSVAAWLECRKHFPNIIPFYLWSVPDLEFVEDNLRYYENFFGARIHRLPHPRCYRMLRQNVFQPPINNIVTQCAQLPAFTYDQQEKWFREELGLPETVYVAAGVRSADSMTRRIAINRYGPINHAKKKFYPVWDWKKDRMLEEFVHSGVKLSCDYRVFGRSFDGINAQFLGPMKQHFPRDYERVLKLFPLAEVELKRWEFAARYRS